MSGNRTKRLGTPQVCRIPEFPTLISGKLDGDISLHIEELFKCKNNIMTQS